MAKKSVPSRIRDTTGTAGNGLVVALDGSPPTAHLAFNATKPDGAAILPIGAMAPYVMAHRSLNEFETGYGKRTGATTFERTTVTENHLGTTVRVAFTGGVKDIFINAHGAYHAELSAADGASVTEIADPAAMLLGVFEAGVPKTISVEDFVEGSGVDAAGLAAIAPAGTHRVTVYDANGFAYTALVSAILALGSGTAPADTTGPSFPDALTSTSVTQTTFRFGWSAATDANGIQKYEYSFDNATWFGAGTALFVDITGRTAGATYTMRARAVDPAGNLSTVRTLVVVMQAASGGTNAAPTMSGSLSVTNQSSGGYTLGWSAATDPDGNLAGYDYSIDAGGTFAQLGNVLSVNVTGRPALTTDQVRVRARDALGLTSNVLSATATTTAAAGPTMAELYVIRRSPTPGAADYALITIPAPGNITTNGYYQANVALRVLKASNGDATAVNEPTHWTWSKADANGNPVKPVLANQTANGQKRAVNRVGGWVDGAQTQTHYGMLGHGNEGTLYIWGAAGTYHLWLFFSDGSALVYDNGTGVPIGLVLN